MSDPLYLKPGNVTALKFENHTRNQYRNLIPFGDECFLALSRTRRCFLAFIKSDEMKGINMPRFGDLVWEFLTT